MRRLGSLALLAWMIHPHLSWAQNEPRARVRFTYARGRGAERCPSPEAVRDAVSARLGYVPFDEHARARIDLRIDRAARGVRALVSWLDADEHTLGERELHGSLDRCDQLVEDASLTISIAIDALPREAPSAPAAAPNESVSTTTTSVVNVELVTTSAPTPVGRPPPMAPTAPRGELWAVGGGALSLGTQPSPGLGATLELGARWRSIALGVEGRFDAPTAVTSQSGGGTTSTSRQSLTALPCAIVRLDSTTLRLGVCASASIGWLSGRGQNVTSPREDSTWLASAGARVFLGFALASHLELRLRAELHAAVRRAVVHLDGAVAWEESPITGSLGIGVAVRFP